MVELEGREFPLDTVLFDVSYALGTDIYLFGHPEVLAGFIRGLCFFQFPNSLGIERAAPVRSRIAKVIVPTTIDRTFFTGRSGKWTHYFMLGHTDTIL